MKVLHLWFTCALIVFNTSFALADIDQSITHTYRYERASAPPIHIEAVRVWPDKTDTYIDGYVSRYFGYTVDPHDYIEITVIDPYGKTLANLQTKYFPKPAPIRYSSRYGNRYSDYVVKIHFIPPAYSTIKASYVRLD